LILIGMVAGGVIVPGGVGCGDEDEGATAAARARLAEGCAINSDCTAPLVCAFERCHTQCKSTRDCPSGQRCVVSQAPLAVCLLPEEDLKCNYNSDCISPKICAQDGLCRDRCKTSRDCLLGQYCGSGSCVDGDEPSGGATTGPVKPGQTPQGSACSYNSDCLPKLVCRESVCAVECKLDVDCDVRERCQDGECVSVGGDGVVYCTPGASVGCDCPGGLRGKQSCLPDGSALGPCEDCQ
jgi:hypothetical protein